MSLKIVCYRQSRPQSSGRAAEWVKLEIYL